MPKIKFVRIKCPHCGDSYRVRLDRIESQQDVECTACGCALDITEVASVLEVVHRYSEAVIKLEQLFQVEGDGETLAVPERPARRGSVTVPLRNIVR